MAVKLSLAFWNLSKPVYDKVNSLVDSLYSKSDGSKASELPLLFATLSFEIVEIVEPLAVNPICPAEPTLFAVPSIITVMSLVLLL